MIRVATGVLDAPVITTPTKALLRWSPLRDVAQRQKWKLKLALGYRLVPEQALTQKYREALSWLAQQEDPQLLGDYLEFGVFNGTSLSCMYRATEDLNLGDMRLFGFDSFEGLPESSAVDEWHPGSYQIDYEYARHWLTQRGIDWSRVFLIKGWFSDTLNQTLINKHQIAKASVIMFDCDAYQSTREALEFCAPLIGPYAILLFDDWNSGGRAQRDIGEKLAMDQFLISNPEFKLEDFGSYNQNSQVFKMRRSTSEPDVARQEPRESHAE